MFRSYIKQSFFSLQKLLPIPETNEFMSMCSSASLLMSTAREWKVRPPELLIWAYSLIHTLAGINLRGLQVGLPACAFQTSRCCKKKWQQIKLALPRLPEHDRLLTVLAKPTELACFSVMVHSSWHCANSYCKPAGLEWGVFTCQRRRAREISGTFQPAFISSSHSFQNFLHPSLPLGKLSFCWQPCKEQRLTLSWWEQEAQAVCVQQQRVSWSELRPARLSSHKGAGRQCRLLNLDRSKAGVSVKEWKQRMAA